MRRVTDEMRVMANLRAAGAFALDSLSQDTSLHTKMLFTGGWDLKIAFVLKERKFRTREQSVFLSGSLHLFLALPTGSLQGTSVCKNFFLNCLYKNTLSTNQFTSLELVNRSFHP